MADRRRRERSTRIRKLVDIASADEKRFGQSAGRLRAELDAQTAQLGELNAYRHAYAEKSRGLSGGRAVHWQDYQSFLGRLDQAVKAQQQIVKDAEQAADAAKRRWISKRQRLDTLTKVWTRFHDEERNARERAEQKRLDDLPAGPAGFNDEATGQ
jgi:flagellar FliJ protein